MLVLEIKTLEQYQLVGLCLFVLENSRKTILKRPKKQILGWLWTHPLSCEFGRSLIVIFGLKSSKFVAILNSNSGLGVQLIWLPWLCVHVDCRMVSKTHEILAKPHTKPQNDNQKEKTVAFHYKFNTGKWKVERGFYHLLQPFVLESIPYRLRNAVIQRNKERSTKTRN